MRYEKEFRQLIDTWGEEPQILITIEELSELSQALCKYLRVKANVEKLPKEEHQEKVQKNLYNVKEEIADVLNCVKQMVLIFGHDDIYKIREQKVKRAMKRLEGK